MRGPERAAAPGSNTEGDRLTGQVERHPNHRVLPGSVEPAPFGHTRTRRCSLDQLRQVHGMLIELGVSDDQDERVLVVSNVLGRSVNSTGHLTRDEASMVIDILRAEIDGNT